MKKLCVLEQSGTIHDPYTAEKKKMFQTENCDYFRLNWRYKDDPDAALSALGVLWSEGRSLLYDHVPKCYDYYMFMDDDIHFNHIGNKQLDEKIIDLLDEYKPISATFYSENLWGGKNPITDYMRQSKKAFQFLCLDLQLTIYSHEFADTIFPVPFHGSDKCMWYAFWLAHKLHPGKQICFSEISVRNDRSEPHYNQNVRIYRDTLVKMFNRLTNDKSFNWDINKCKEQNSLLFHEDIDKTPFIFDIENIKKLCQWNSKYIQWRSPVKNIFHKLFIDPQLRFITKKHEH